MIFSPSLVTLSYAFGILFFTYLIRRYNLLGAGFFWLMYATSTVLCVLSFLSDTHFLLLLTIFLSGYFLIEGILNRSNFKELDSKRNFLYLNILIAFFLVTIFYSYSAISKEDVSSTAIEIIRIFSGAALLGGVTTAMLLGHWYLVQPGLSRKPISDICLQVLCAVIVNTLLWFTRPSMFDVFTGDISDGWGGTLGFMWIGSVLTTIVLIIAARKALKEKSYSAVMATTGLLYLAILTANGVELIPRAIFS